MSMTNTDWHNRPYYTLDAWCKNQFHYKCYKVALNAHMNCPNRDGSIGTRGCIFCSEGGSGEFAVDIRGLDIQKQLNEGIRRIAGKLPDTSFEKPCIIAYFQAYTNTYAPLPYLKEVFTEALSCPMVLGISVATRPDCLPGEVIGLLSALKEAFPEKFIWIELGLQTIHGQTAAYIRRGYPLSCFETACRALFLAQIPTIVHVILGLPNETREQMYETVRYVNAIRPFGVKFQLLHVLAGTDLAADYAAGQFQTLTKEAYLDIVIRCLELLSPEITVHRVTGDGPKDILIAPDWSRNKKDVLNSLHALMKERHTHQGLSYQKPSPQYSEDNHVTGSIDTL